MNTFFRYKRRIEIHVTIYIESLLNMFELRNSIILGDIPI